MNIELHVDCISVDMYASHALLLLYVYIKGYWYTKYLIEYM